MNIADSNACTEALELLKYIPIDEYHMIPKEVFETLEKNKNAQYKYVYNTENPEVSERALAIITRIYIDYIATDFERRKIQEILKLNSIKEEENKRKKYKMDYLSKRNKPQGAIQELPIKIEERWYMRFINNLKTFFKNVRK